MENKTKPLINSKLPEVGTTIFTVMSQLASENDAVNLSQGFPNFPVSAELIELVHYYMKNNFNQYAPMSGIKELRESISEKTFNIFKVNYHPDKEITITSGATEALYAAISCVVEKGDEVMVFEPAYDCYVPAILMNGGIPVFISLKPPYYKIDWNLVKQRISEKTKLIILNSPHNPTGSVLYPEDIKSVAEIIRDKNIFLLGDEVYEHIIFDGLSHQSLMSNSILQERSFIIGSFGKTFHVTGWKVGFCLAPEDLTVEFRKVHQFLTFCTNTPVQYALAQFLKKPQNFLELPQFYQGKRDFFLQTIKNSRFDFLPSSGTYFQNLSYSRITDENDFDLAVRLTKEIGVASIPVSAFYHKKEDYKILRFCFAKDEKTMEKAGEMLSKL